MGKFNAEPSKDFFIEMLTRDIPLEWAILDLIDNSVDGARNEINAKGKSLKSKNVYAGYKIEVNFNSKEFVIKDNCGGFNKKAALEYAFKFGRPKSLTDFPKGSVGRFGVGMKRGIFKIGNYFVVETKSGKDHFIVEEDIDLWNKPDREWDFNYTDIKMGETYKKQKPVLSSNGTFIKVEKLNDPVAQEFSNIFFERKLIDEIQRILSYSIQQGLEVIVNNNSLDAKPITLLVGDNLLPYFLEENIDGVNVRIYAGIGEPNPNVAGWYIFCNDRLMVEKDKTNLTGWEGGEKYFNDAGVQKYHNKVAMFRGLVFFDADNSSLLPMTTIKTGIDVNSSIYKTTRSKMVEAMKTVLAHLNKLQNDEQRQQIVVNYKSVDIVSYKKNKLTQEFVFPKSAKQDAVNNIVRISYNAVREEVEAVKKSLKVNTNELVGSGTFEYYLKMKEIEI